MATDIGGWVEVADAYGLQTYTATIHVPTIVGRDAESVAHLFGVNNTSKFIPVFPITGFPVGPVSSQALRDYGAARDAESGRWQAHHATVLDWTYIKPFYVTGVRIGSFAGISRDWVLLFELMEVLARRHGREAVRLVVWFEN